LQREKVRIYALARELNIESKDLLDICHKAGIDVKNQLSSLDPEQRDAVELLLKQGGNVAVAAPAKQAAAPTVGPNLGRIKNLDSGKVRSQTPPRRETPPGAAPAVEILPVPPTEVPAPAVISSPRPSEPTMPVIPVESPAAAAPVVEKAPAPPVNPVVPAVEIKPTPPSAPVSPPLSPAAGPTTTSPTPLRMPGASGRVPDLVSRGSSQGTGRVPSLGQGRPDSARGDRKRPAIPRPPSTIRIAPPPPLKQSKLDEKKAQQPIAKIQEPIQYLPEDVVRGERSITAKELLGPHGKGPAAPVVADDEEEDAEARKSGKARVGGVVGRGERHAKRSERSKAKKARETAFTTRAGVVVEEERPQRSATKSRLERLKAKQRGPTQPRKGKVSITLPITVRSLSEAVGLRSVDLLFKLRDHGAATTININSSIDPDLAVLLASELGCELEVKRPVNAEEQLLAERQKTDNPDDLVPRAPIVTIMGHVDHGKTSLLDRIRQSNVAATEAGGITQVIRAWRVEHNGKPITFLDTPGHEAFTKMRARGANVTDIAVIVVAADDGVMPQTEEAINHAKAAGVSIVVAINKIDLPNANIKRAEQQLYGMGLIPDTMGGEVPFVYTSAASGKGISDLLETLTLVAEYTKELKANPNKPARGTVLEAMLSEGEGVLATLLVQDGTLRRGDVVLCGASHGRVRAMYDDLGNPITEAGPSVPVRITGLDFVPNADDPFMVVPDLTTARDIAVKRQTRQQEAAMTSRAPVSLESLSESKIVELKVILKADFRGSIEAIRKELDKLQHAEVRVRLLYAAIGGITESDIDLALASPQDTIVVGFNVVPDDRAKALAEDRGVQVRQYNIIYNLTDDIRSALEGKLKPREEIVHLGRAVVRDTFKISRVGTIAGCFVTQGIIERSAKVKLIRDGIVIYPPAERSVGLESLKRYKDDVRDVREGFECGLKVAGYDDVKVGDVIEAYRVEQIQRTLS